MDSIQVRTTFTACLCGLALMGIFATIASLLGFPAHYGWGVGAATVDLFVLAAYTGSRISDNAMKTIIVFATSCLSPAFLPDLIRLIHGDAFVPMTGIVAATAAIVSLFSLLYSKAFEGQARPWGLFAFLTYVGLCLGLVAWQFPLKTFYSFEAAVLVGAVLLWWLANRNRIHKVNR